MSKNPTITKAKEEVILQSLSRIVLMSNLLLLEYQTVLVETVVKAPIINNYIKRIKSDALAIQQHIGGTLASVVKDDFPLDYSMELYVALSHLTHFSLEQITEFNTNLGQELAKGNLQQA